MEHELRRQIPRRRRHGLPRRQRRDRIPYSIELGHDRPPPGAMDRTVHTTPTDKGGIGRVGDGVDGDAGDVSVK
jgi:hypothetical protein